MRSRPRWCARLGAGYAPGTLAHSRDVVVDLGGAAQLLAFPCGLIAGGLAALGLVVDVRAEVLPDLPGCRFNIEVRG